VLIEIIIVEFIDCLQENKIIRDIIMFIPEKCNFCGECLESCPYIEYDQERAKKEIRELIEGKNPPVVSACITCAACNTFCPQGANPFDLINARQEETGSFFVPEALLAKYEQAPHVPSVLKKGDPGKPVMNLCMVGDMARGQLDNPIFEGLSIVEGGDYFCSVGYMHMGMPGRVEKNAQKYVDNLASLGFDEVVCFHDDCYALLTHLARDYGIEVPFRPVHLFEYLYREMKNRINEIKLLNLKVAYQSPCASRYTPEKDIYLDKLLALIGVERVKRKYEGLNALCCGAPLIASDRKRAIDIKMLNVNDAAENNADHMIFLCPMCYLNLKKICDGNNIKPIFISDLCKMAFKN